MVHTLLGINNNVLSTPFRKGHSMKNKSIQKLNKTLPIRRDTMKLLIQILMVMVLLVALPVQVNAGSISKNKLHHNDKAQRDPKSCFGPGLIDIDEFETWIHRRLEGNVVGYGFAISEGGIPIGFGQGGFAQIPVLENNIVFTFLTNIQVASVSKPITAIALLQLMEKLDVEADDAISTYLPENWNKGKGFDLSGITFDDLLTHQTGFEQAIALLLNEMGDKLPGTNTWEGLQQIVATGIPESVAASSCPKKNEDGSYTLGEPETPSEEHYGVYCYKNANYALARELIAQMALQSGDLGDEFYEKDPALMPMASASGYQKYVQDYVLAPAGVVGACQGTGDLSVRTMMYDIDGNVPFEMLTTGVDAHSDEKSNLLNCGPYNWSLNALDLVKIMGELNCGDLLSLESKELMHKRKMGFSQGSNSSTYPDRYWHSGKWTKSRTNVTQALWPQHQDHPANNPSASEEDCVTIGADLVCPANGSATNTLHTCVIEFPHEIDAALILNSNIRNEPDANACNVLHDAFDELF